MIRNWLKNNCLYLRQFKWFRKFVGGKWELWYVDLLGIGYYWHDVILFTHELQKHAPKYKDCYPLDLDNPYYWGYRPTPLCRGTPVCEEYETI